VPPPGGESLKDTLARTLPYYVQEICPACCAASARWSRARQFAGAGAIMVLEKLSPQQILARRTRHGVPVIYRLNADATGGRRRLRSGGLNHMAAAGTDDFKISAPL